MGCFDTIYVACPRCDKVWNFQSKGGDCLGRDYTLFVDEIPADVLSDVNRHGPVDCSCGSRFYVDISNPMDPEVMILGPGEKIPEEASKLPSPATRLIVEYKNWKGITRKREINPTGIWFGETEYHPGRQWFLRAVDLEDSKVKDFALSGFTSFQPISNETR